MEAISQSWKRLKRSIKEFHTKKPHIEFFTALLTIPVLLTVIILNINNLKGDKAEPEPAKNETIVITQAAPNEKEVIVTKVACEKGIGDVSIISPQDGDMINDNPVMVDINYDAGEYCAVVWSYRINGGSWSSYDDRSIALYNLPSGNVKLDLRVKSVVNSEQENLSVNFVYTGSTGTPTPSESITITPAPTQ